MKCMQNVATSALAAFAFSATVAAAVVLIPAEFWQLWIGAIKGRITENRKAHYFLSAT